jgi:dihydroflavonol-4-reductase
MTAALAAGIERVVYTSSVATLGLVPGDSADEETPSSFDDMIGPYKQSKFAAEEVVRELAREHGLPVVIVNPSTPVGPGDVKPTPTGRLIVEAARGQMPAFVDTGLNIVHVDDVAEGHLAAAEKGLIGDRYILGGENLTLAGILAEVAAAVGRRAPRLRVPHSALLPVAFGAELAARISGREPFVTLDGVRMSRKKMYFSSEKASREFGYTPRPARQAIADAVSWFRDNGYLQ